MRNRPLGIAAAIVLALIGGALAVAPAFVPPYRPAVTSEKGHAVPQRDSNPDRIDVTTALGSATVARSFIHPQQRNAAVGAREATPPQGGQTSVAEWLRPLGLVADEAGVVRIYLKDARNGRLIGIRRDGREEDGNELIEENDSGYTVSIQGSLYIVPRRKK